MRGASESGILSHGDMDRPHHDPWVKRSLLVAALWLIAAPMEAEPAEQSAEAKAVTIQDKMAVQLDYTLTVDGQVMDSSEGHGPFQYVHGKGQIIPGLERQLAGLQIGDSRELTVTPEEGYGPVDPAAVMEVPRAQMPSTIAPKVGQVLRGVGANGRSFRATIREIHDDTVTLDLNHPLAGRTLLFKIKVLSISPSA